MVEFFFNVNMARFILVNGGHRIDVIGGSNAKNIV